jgi:hypothetical protein
MYMTIITMILLAGLVLFLRGGTLHNHLVLVTENTFKAAGFKTQQECPQRLPDGRLDFIDILAQKGNCVVCIEVETSARYVLTNAAKADQLGMPLIVVVPNRTVKMAVQKKLARDQTASGGVPIYILLLSQVEKEVTNYFPLFSSVNSEWKNKKTNQISEK